VADVVDRAQGVVEVCTEEAERRIRKQVGPETHPDFDGAHCVTCEEPIPAARLALGKVRCVYCQEDLEKGRL
jgi:RNA polymerase-binding transcription factor DksA